MKIKLLALVLLVNSAFCQGYNYQSYFVDSVLTPVVKTDTIYKEVFLRKNSDLLSDPQLHNKYFKKNAYFIGTHFPGVAGVYSSTFSGDADFSGVTFKDIADFSDDVFKKDITFASDTFNSTLFLPSLTTDGLTRFNFYRANLPDIIDFSHNKTLSSVVDFTDADFDTNNRKEFYKYKIFYNDNRHFINLFNSDIDKVKLDYLHFRMYFCDIDNPDKILQSYLNKNNVHFSGNEAISNTRAFKALLKSTEFENYISEVFPQQNIDDTKIKDFACFYLGKNYFPSRLSKDQVEALYSKLLKNFNSNGQKMSYESLDVDFHNYVSFSGYINVSHFWNCYGYHKERIFAWSAFFLILFTFISFKNFEKLFVKTDNDDAAYTVEKIPDLVENDKKLKFLKLKYAFIYTSLIFFSFTLKIENLNFKKPGLYYIVIVNLFGLLCLGYLANFILQK